jgi:hypothetical protein
MVDGERMMKTVDSERTMKMTDDGLFFCSKGILVFIPLVLSIY